MTIEKAYQILGVSEVHSLEEIKKQYRILMMKTHPDMQLDHGYPYDAGQINVAYECLIKYRKQRDSSRKPASKKEVKAKHTIHWNAPINPNAYAPRLIFHRVEDAYGNIVGEAILDEGYYDWIPDEEFSLFLKSIYLCGKSLLEKANKGKEILSDLVYLLAQQYVSSEQILTFARENNGIYSVDGMLEMHGNDKIQEGDLLYPSRMLQHRLYVCNMNGKELGYISFKDDRLYYGIIPMFERKAVKIKIIVSDQAKSRMNRKNFRQVQIMMIKNYENKIQMMENLNLQIENLLYGDRKEERR